MMVAVTGGLRAWIIQKAFWTMFPFINKYDFNIFDTPRI